MTEPLLPSKIRLAISQSRGSVLIVAGDIRPANPLRFPKLPPAKPAAKRCLRRCRRTGGSFVRAVAQRRTPNRASPTGLKSSSSDPNTFVVIPFSHGKGERSHGSARSSATKRTIDELSSREKRQVADDLMLPISFLRGGAHGGGPFARVSAGSLLLPFRARAERRSVRCPCNILTPRKWRLVGEPVIGEWILSAGERAPPSKPPPSNRRARSTLRE